MSDTQRYAIRVTYPSGDEAFLVRGLCADGPIALFPSKEAAEEQRAFLLEGISDEVQSVDVVLAPTKEAEAPCSCCADPTPADDDEFYSAPWCGVCGHPGKDHAGAPEELTDEEPDDE